MFEDTNSSGKHLICDFKNITNIKLLNSKLELKLMCKDLCIENNYTILGEIDYEFHPQGCSFLFLLSESHLSVHTFPEKNHLAFDLYTCRQYENNNVYIEIFFKLCEKLGTTCQECEYNIIDRTFISTFSKKVEQKLQPFSKVEATHDILENDPLGFHL
jgi:S-adenosylmethionine/arginine decarboxylase-like enzyme